MSAYLEVLIKGDCRAYIEAGAIMGVINSPGCAADQMATSDTPLTLIMRSGDTISDVYGRSANRLLVHAAGAKMLLREEGRLCLVVYLDKLEEFEASISARLLIKDQFPDG